MRHREFNAVRTLSDFYSKAMNAPRIALILCLILCAPSCRRSDTTSGVSVEVDSFVTVKLRPPGKPADLRNAKVIGSPTEFQIKEVAEVIGRIDMPWRERVD